MARFNAILFLAVLLPTLVLAQHKNKKHSEVPAVFQYAHFIFVEAADGNSMKPDLFPADRQAIFDVQDGLADWNRYTLANRREQADVVLVVRKGRLASAQARTGINLGSRQSPNQNQNRSAVPLGDSDGPGVATEIGSENDILRVYLVAGDGKLTGPVWTRELADGLEAPPLRLLQMLRTAVEQAYPTPPPAKQPTP